MAGSRRLLTRHWWLIPLTVLIAIVSLDWTEQPDGAAATDAVDMRDTESDYYLESFTTRKFDADGSLEYEVRGNSLAHYPADQRSEILAPRVILHQPDGQWRVSSSRGELNEDPEVFTFVDTVVIERHSGEAPPVVITTSALDIDTEANTVSTDARIDIRTEGWSLSSIGMRSTLDEGNLELLSNVSGHYEVARTDNAQD